MDAFTLPTAGVAEPHFKFFCDLDGRSYGLEFHWNADAAAWFLTVRTSDDTILRAGIRVVVDAALGGRVSTESFWPGLLIAQDSTDRHEDPLRDDLSSGRTLLLYFPAGA